MADAAAAMSAVRLRCLSVACLASQALSGCYASHPRIDEVDGGRRGCGLGVEALEAALAELARAACVGDATCATGLGWTLDECAASPLSRVAAAPNLLAVAARGDLAVDRALVDQCLTGARARCSNWGELIGVDWRRACWDAFRSACPGADGVCLTDADCGLGARCEGSTSDGDVHGSCSPDVPGRCVSLEPRLGEPCTDSAYDCACIDSVCRPMYANVRTAREGEPCDEWIPVEDGYARLGCEPHLWCRPTGVPAVPTCVAVPGLGEPCVGACQRGLVCSLAGTCEPLPRTAVGDPCGGDPCVDAVALCNEFSVCEGTSGARGELCYGLGTSLYPCQDGLACDTPFSTGRCGDLHASGEFCRSDGDCLSGRCAWPDGSLEPTCC